MYIGYQPLGLFFVFLAVFVLLDGRDRLFGRGRLTGKITVSIEVEA
jgi:hypothetical protein